MREKARDVEDLALRLLSNISSNKTDEVTSWKNRILIVRELLPSDILKITLEDVAGIIQVGGGITSHISILVRSLDIPMIIVDDPILMQVSNGSQILMDAYCGNIFVNPSEETVHRFNERERVRETVENQKEAMADKTTLADGSPVRLLANINLLSEIDLALDLKAEGVGLYRSEFPFLVRQTLPTEDEQHAIYTRLLQRMQDQEVTIRTLDAGGDKVIALFDDSLEPNPALGLRSTRLTLRYTNVFNQQIRAILRAGANTDSLSIMFPMIASIDDFTETRSRLMKCIDDLREEGTKITNIPRIGIMLEMPAILEIIDDLAKAADFFSIGTNDFIQYMLAADRTNDRVAEYYIPHHPAVLRGLKRIADAANKHNIPCAVCGEMAHDLRYIPFLIGIGIRTLSIDPHYLPEVQKQLLGLSPETAKDYAQQLLAESSIKNIEKLLITA
jgi:phosphotransferase system enzyme I (PtsP)